MEGEGGSKAHGGYGGTKAGGYQYPLFTHILTTRKFTHLVANTVKRKVHQVEQKNKNLKQQKGFIFLNSLTISGILKPFYWDLNQRTAGSNK